LGNELLPHASDWWLYLRIDHAIERFNIRNMDGLDGDRLRLIRWIGG